MKPSFSAHCLLFLALAATASAEEFFRFQTPNPEKLEIGRGKNGPVLATQTDTATHRRPYIHPLRSPDGKGVLTQFSPGHHKHQTGLYWGPTRINGRDYFHNYGPGFWTEPTTYSDELEKKPVANWGTACHLLDGAGKPVLEDHQHWTLWDYEDYYTIDLTWTGKALVDVTIGKYDYGGLFLRMPWKRGVPAEVFNSEGDKDQGGEGKAAKWIDLAMKIEGMEKMAHVAMIDHPSNSGHPTLWRIDGQFGVGPALSRRGDIKIPSGETATYCYRLVVYQGDRDQALIEKEQKKFAAAVSPSKAAE